MSHYADGYISKLMGHTYCEFCKYMHGKIHADFEYFNHVVYKAFFIIDSNLGNRSVTNDIEYVLWKIKEDCKEQFGLPDYDLRRFKIFYRDSQKRWDKILIQSNRFHFMPLSEDDKTLFPDDLLQF